MPGQMAAAHGACRSGGVFPQYSSLWSGVLPVSYTHLDVYKRQIQLKLVDKAKELLCATNKSVSEIAYELGFNDPHHLSRMFKKNTGCSPNEFRLSA